MTGRTSRARIRLVVTTLVVCLVAACTDAAPADDGDRTLPSVIVTTDLLGDVLGTAWAGVVDVRSLVPQGVDPHAFQASASDAGQLREADLVVANGGGFEEGLEPVLESAAADGVTVIDTLPLLSSSEDPHFFTDPVLVREAVSALTDILVEQVDGLDESALEAAVEEYLEVLDAVDDDVERLLASIPASDRVLVTDHDVFGPFAERYGFEVAAAIIPGGGSDGAVSGGRLDELADLLRERGVRAVFTDAAAPERLARTLAAEVGDVTVVALYAETLGPEGSDGATYPELMRTNAQRIASALGS